IPWVMFALTGALTAIGAVSPAAVAIVAPIALSFATRYAISPLLMGTMVVHGAQAGGFSPISIYGSIVNGIVEREGLPGSEVGLFLASLIANLLIASVLFAVLGGRKLWARGAVPVDGAAGPAGTTETTGTGAGGGAEKGPGKSTGTGTGTAGTAPTAVAVRPDQDSDGTGGATRLTPARIATLVALVALVVAVLGFDLDAGLTAVSLAVVLSTAWPDDSRRAVGEIAWSTVLLICGVLTYVGVLEEMGTITWAGEGVGGIGVPLLAAVLLCYIGAIVSAFASSVGIMGALIPLAVPFLAQGEIGAVGMVAALAVSATVVDVSPFSTNGALVLAAAPDVDRDRFFRQLMVYGGIVVAAVPALAWLVLVVPGFG
ncbi:SLC13 family permease, partial [Streptomyces sp. NPDC057074]|uniref:SLC13 family permease n=1 Tax=Streptomyces sp. NPDC057074 TaxID=3346015 RepID=UPI00362E90A0